MAWDDYTADSIDFGTSDYGDITSKYFGDVGTEEDTDWDYSFYDRVSEQLMNEFGSVWKGVSLVADKFGLEGARDWASNRGDELFQKAADLQVDHTSLSDAWEEKSPVKFLQWGTEALTSLGVSVAETFAGGGIGGVAMGGKLGSSIISRNMAKELLANNTRAVAKELGESVSISTIRQEAYKRTAQHIGRIAGGLSVEGVHGAAQAAATEIEEVGYEDASLLRPAVVGVLTAAISKFSPVEMAAAKGTIGKLKDKSWSSVVGTMFKEGSEELGQDLLQVAHKAGIDPNTTFQDAINNPDVRWALAESFAAGMLGGTVFGAMQQPWNKTGKVPTKEEATEYLDRMTRAQRGEMGKKADLKTPDVIISGPVGQITATAGMLREDLARIFVGTEAAKTAPSAPAIQEVLTEAYAPTPPPTKLSPAEMSAGVFEAQRGTTQEAPATAIMADEANIAAMEKFDSIVADRDEAEAWSERYVQDKNQKREIATLLNTESVNAITTAKNKAAVKAEIARLMSQVEEDSNNVRSEFTTPQQKVEAKKNVDKNIVKLTNVLSGKESVEIDTSLVAPGAAYGTPLSPVTTTAAETSTEEGGTSERVITTPSAEDVATARLDLAKTGLTPAQLRAREERDVNTDTFIRENGIENPLTVALLKGDMDAVMAEVADRADNSKKAAIANALKDVAPIIPKNSEFYDNVRKSTATALSLVERKTNKFSGQKTSDPIGWDKVENGVQRGVHKESNNISVTIESESGTMSKGPWKVTVFNRDQKVSEKSGIASLVDARAFAHQSVPALVSYTRTRKGKVEKSEVVAKVAEEIRKEGKVKTSKKEEKAKPEPVRTIKVSEKEKEAILARTKARMEEEKKKKVVKEFEEEREVEVVEKKSEGYRPLDLEEGGLDRETASLTRRSKVASAISDMKSGKKVGDTAITILNELEYSYTPEFKALATLLKKSFSSKKLNSIPVISNILEKGERSYYSPYYDAVILRDDANDRVKMHEIIHALTVHAYDTDPQFKNNVDRIFSSYKKTLLDSGKISKGVLKAAEDKKTFNTAYSENRENPFLYSLKNAHEFVSEVFSNTQVRILMQDTIDTTTYEDTTLLERFSKEVKKLFTRIVKGKWTEEIVYKPNTLFENLLNDVLSIPQRSERKYDVITPPKTVEYKEPTEETTPLFTGIFTKDSPLSILTERLAAKEAAVKNLKLRVDILRDEFVKLMNKEDKTDKETDELIDVMKQFDLNGSRLDVNLEYIDDLKERIILGKKLEDDGIKNAYDLLNYAASKIEGRKSGSPLMRTFARMLMDNVGEAELSKIRIVPSSEKVSSSSFYSGTDHSIYIHPEHFRSNSAYIHEVVHSLSVWQYYENEMFRNKVDTLRNYVLTSLKNRVDLIDQRDLSLVEQLNDMNMGYDETIDTFVGWKNSGLFQDDGIIYGLLDSSEFLAEALGNAAFQNMLLQIPPMKEGQVTSKNVMRQLLDYIVKALKFDGPHELKSSVLWDIVGIVKEGYGMPVSEPFRSTPRTMRKPKGIGKEYTEEELEEKHLKGLAEHAAYTRDKWEDVKAYGRSIARLGQKYFRSISSILNDASPILAAKMRGMEMEIRRKTMKRHGDIAKFVKGLKSIPDSIEKSKLYYSLFNGNSYEELVEREELLIKHGLWEEYVAIQFTLDKIRKEAEAVGLNEFPNIEGYFPRFVKDIDGLIKAMKKEGDDYGKIKQAVDVAFKGVGFENATEEQVAEVVISILKTGRWPAFIKKPTASKERTIHRVLSKYMKYYARPEDALVNHVFEMTEAIEGRKFIGVTSQSKYLKEIENIKKELKSADLDPEREDLLSGRLERYIRMLTDTKYLINESVSTYIAKLVREGKLKGEDEGVVSSAIRARLTQRGMHGPMSHVRDVGLVTSLGSFMSTMTQMNDIIHSIFEYGLANTASAIFNKKTLAIHDLDLGHVMTELSSSPTSRLVDTVLTWSGFKHLDGFLKATSMEAAIRYARNMSREEFFGKYEKIFADKTADMYKATHAPKLDKENRDLRFFAFYELSNLQPISMSEMPMGYNTAGNGRILYTLKSYNLKIANRLYDKLKGVWDKDSSKEERTKALTQFAIYMALLTLSGASVDELKDWMTGKEKPFGDNVNNNMLKLFFMSRYTLDKGFRDGFASTILRDVLAPPVGWIDTPVADITNWVQGESSYKSLKLIPIGGKIIYEWTPEGKANELAQRRKFINELIRGTVTGEESWSTIRKQIVEFNRDANQLNKMIRIKDLELEKVGLINSVSISRVRKEEIKKMKENK